MGWISSSFPRSVDYRTGLYGLDIFIFSAGEHSYRTLRIMLNCVLLYNRSKSFGMHHMYMQEMMLFKFRWICALQSQI